MAFALSTPQLSMLPCGKPPLQVKLVGVLCKQLICSTAVLAYIRCLALMGELVATGISPHNPTWEQALQKADSLN